MALIMRSGPLSEAVSLDEVKSHLRIDGASEDALLASLVLTSRLHIETALGLALMTQGWSFVLDAWPAGGVVSFPIAPVLAIDEIRVRDGNGGADTIAADRYEFAGAGRPQRVVCRDGRWPSPGTRVAGIEIDFTAGYGANPDDVPAPVRQALLLLVAHWYEHRDPFEIGAPQTHVPSAVSRLLAPYRAVRL